MSRSKKPTEQKYGIQITKPFSKEMYDHNNMVAKEMKENILQAWKTLLNKQKVHDEESLMESSWEFLSDDSDLVKLQKGVCYSGYGSGYTIGDVNNEFEGELENMQNWQLHEQYSYMSFEGLLPRTQFMMIGFGWEKHDYDNQHTDQVANNIVNRLTKNSIDNE